MKRLERARVPPDDGQPPATLHLRGGQTIERAVHVEVVESDGAFYLFHLDEQGDILADTWHLTREEARDQAHFEFGIEASDWTPC